MKTVLALYQNPDVLVSLQYDRQTRDFLVVRQKYASQQLLDHSMFLDFASASAYYKKQVDNEIDALTTKSIDDFPKYELYDYEGLEDIANSANCLESYLWNVKDIVRQIQDAYHFKGKDGFEGEVYDLMHTELLNPSSLFRVVTFPDGSSMNYGNRNSLLYGNNIEQSCMLLEDIKKALGTDWTVSYRQYYNVCQSPVIYVEITKNYYKDTAVQQRLEEMLKEGYLQASLISDKEPKEREECAWKYLTSYISDIYSRVRERIYAERKPIEAVCSEFDVQNLLPLLDELISFRIQQYKLSGYLKAYLKRPYRPQPDEKEEGNGERK